MGDPDSDRQQKGISRLLIRDSNERPLRGWIRNLFYGGVLAIVLTIVDALLASGEWWRIVGYSIIGPSVALFEWGSERLWFSTLSKMFTHSFSWYAYATRIPFWYLSGGMAFVLGMLIVKKFGIFWVYDLPVKDLFDIGGVLGCTVQIPLQFVMYRISRKELFAQGNV